MSSVEPRKKLSGVRKAHPMLAASSRSEAAKSFLRLPREGLPAASPTYTDPSRSTDSMPRSRSSASHIPLRGFRNSSSSMAQTKSTGQPMAATTLSAFR